MVLPYYEDSVTLAGSASGQLFVKCYTRCACVKIFFFLFDTPTLYLQKQANKMPLPKELPRTGRAVGGAGVPPGVLSAARVKGERQDVAVGVDAGRKVLANRYRLGQKLGSGAFGCAYLVFDIKSNSDK